MTERSGPLLTAERQRQSVLQSACPQIPCANKRLAAQISRIERAPGYLRAGCAGVERVALNAMKSLAVLGAEEISAPGTYASHQAIRLAWRQVAPYPRRKDSGAAGPQIGPCGTHRAAARCKGEGRPLSRLPRQWISAAPASALLRRLQRSRGWKVQHTLH